MATKRNRSELGGYSMRLLKEIRNLMDNYHVSATIGWQTWGQLDDGMVPLPDTYYRVREGIERFFITDINNPAASAMAQSTIPVMYDAFVATNTDNPNVAGHSTANFNHLPGGSNVLWMDGHITFIRYKLGGDFPIMVGENPHLLSSWSFQYITMWGGYE